MPATTILRSYDRPAYELRLTGLDYPAIGRQFGITGNQAYTAVRRWCAANAVVVPTRSALRQGGWTSARSRGNQAQLAARFASGVSTRRFGVEIECFGITPAAAAAALRAAGLESSSESYNHSTRPYWKVIYDASVNGAGTGQGYGLEVVSPILSGEAGLTALRTAMNALKAAGARVDRTCGMHVHHECDDLTGSEASNLVLLWAGKQGTLNRLVAPSRRSSGGYCAPFRAGEASAIAARFAAFGASTVPADRRQQFGSYDRYRTLNVASFPRYGTIEVRQHQGTLNATKAAAWVQMGQAIITAAKAGAALRDGADMLADLTAHGLAAEVATYLTERMDTVGA